MKIRVGSLRVLMILVIVSFLIGCGGNNQSNNTRKAGEGGGGETTPATISYTGLTTPAVITNTNAIPIAEGAFAGGTQASSFALSETAEAYPQPAASGIWDNKNLYSRSKPFSECALRIRTNTTAPNPSEKFAPLAIVTETDTIVGTCGGEVTYTIQIDDQSGAFSGNFVFSNYCEAGTAITGSATVDGTADLVQGVIETINYTFDEIQSSDVAMKGTVSVDDSEYPPNSSISFNMLIKDKSTEKVHKFDNYIVLATDGAVRTAFDLSGTYYHPDYGYVTVSTPNEFLLGFSDDWPYTGDLICIGANGAQVKLSALNISTYDISVDLNGDSVFETVMGPFNWSDF